MNEAAKKLGQELTLDRLTKREEFASMFMRHILPRYGQLAGPLEDPGYIPEKLASVSVKYADALLVELAREDA